MSLLSDDEQPMSDQNSLLGARRPSSAPAPRKTIKFRKSNLLESIPDSNLTNLNTSKLDNSQLKLPDIALKTNRSKSLLAWAHWDAKLLDDRKLAPIFCSWNTTVLWSFFQKRNHDSWIWNSRIWFEASCMVDFIYFYPCSMYIFWVFLTNWIIAHWIFF